MGKSRYTHFKLIRGGKDGGRMEGRNVGRDGEKEGRGRCYLYNTWMETVFSTLTPA